MPIIQKQNFAITDTIRASFKDGRYLKAIHMHQFAEIVYVMEGELCVKTKQNQTIAKAGDLVVIYPYQYHGFYTEQGNTVKLWMLLFTDTLIMDIIKTEASYEEYEDAVFTPSLALKTFLLDKMIDTQENLHEINMKEKRHLKALLYPIFDEYLNTATVSDHHEKRNSDIINAVLKYAKLNFFNDVTISDCSKTIGYSKSHISHCLSKSLKQTFSEILNSFRISYARNLLRNENMSIFNVGIECGFNCERSFQRAFKNATGMTPKQFRENK